MIPESPQASPASHALDAAAAARVRVQTKHAIGLIRGGLRELEALMAEPVAAVAIRPCKAFNAKGEPCSFTAIEGIDYCGHHRNKAYARKECVAIIKSDNPLYNGAQCIRPAEPNSDFCIRHGGG